MSLNIFEALQIHAEAQPTIYFLHGRLVYPDEIFCQEGFMPLIGRMAERRLLRALESRQSMLPAVGVNDQRDPVLTCSFCATPANRTAMGERKWFCHVCGTENDCEDRFAALAQNAHASPIRECGFSYLPYRDGVFMERVDASPAGGKIVEDGLRLMALVHASRNVVGLGIEGTLDLTPVYDFFMQMQHEERDALRREESISWPLYQPIRVL